MFSIVGTPIGNIQDISLRATRTLLQSQFVLCEDTRTAGIFLRRIYETYLPVLELEHIAFHLPVLMSYHKENEFEKIYEVIDLIQSGKDVALISEAGMPLISDPGYLLVKTLIEKQLPFSVIPGPTAVTTALVYSGFKSPQWMFVGFLPKKPNDLKRLIGKIQSIKSLFPELSVVAYESPHRILDTLATLKTVAPELHIVITRELTKKFEEIIRQSTDRMVLKGEITLVMQ